MKQRKQLLNSLGLPSPHLSQHLLRLLLLLVTLGGVTSSWAETYTVTKDNLDATNVKTRTFTKDGVTITVTNPSGGDNLNTNNGFKLSGGATIQISAASGTTIANIKLVTDSQQGTFSIGSDDKTEYLFGESGFNTTISGSSQTITYAGNNKTKLTSIAVTYTTSGGGSEPTSGIIFSLTDVKENSTSIAAGSDLSLTSGVDATITGGSALVHNGGGSASQILDAQKRINLAGSGNSYLQINLTYPLKDGDKISIVDAGKWKVAVAGNNNFGTKNDLSASSPVTINSTTNSELIGEKVIRFYKTSVSGDPTAITSLRITRGTDYTVSYDLNGGTGTIPASGTYFSGETFTVASGSGITKTGYNFANWNDGSADYAAGSTYTMGSADVTLTAQWTAKTYHIKYRETDETSIDVTPNTHTYGTATTLGTPANKAGYTFAGWYLNKNLSGDPITVLGATDYTADITVYAKWTQATTTIGGTDIDWNASENTESAEYTLVNGQSCQFSFINTSASGQDYYTWCLMGKDASNSDVLATRPYGFGWITGNPNPDIIYEGAGASWANYMALLRRGSATTVTASYHNGKIHVSAVNKDVENNRTYTLTFASQNVTGEVKLRFHIDHTELANFVKSDLTPVTGISLNKTSATLEEGGDTETLTATVNPAGATYKDYIWSTNDATKATVSSTGVVTPISAGIANITATTLDGLYTATCNVTIESEKSISDITTSGALNSNNNRWTPKSGETLAISNYISTSSNGSYTYQSSNTSVATVSDAGVITAGSSTGTATITVTQAADATYATGVVEIVVDVIANKSDASSNTYTVATGDKVSNGTQIIRKDVTMTYGGENFWGIGASDTHGAYIASLTNPVVEGNVPSAGTYYKFHATKSGKLSVNIKGGQNKTLVVSNNGTLIGYKDNDGKDVAAGTAFAAPYYGNVTFPVVANTDYYLYCTNSKLAVYGFEFSPNATITLNANGGSGSMAAIEAEVGTDVAISHNTFTGPSSTPYFTGWNTAANGSGTAYTDGDMIHVDGDVTLYAQWSNNASRGVTLLSYTVSGTIAANTTYPADEGTVMFNTKNTALNDGAYIKGILPEGYKLEAGDKIIITGSANSSNNQGVLIANSTTKPTKDSHSNAVVNIAETYTKNTVVSLTYTVTDDDVTTGVLKNLSSFYVFRYNSTWTLSSIKVIRDVNYKAQTSNSSDITVTFNPASDQTLTEGKVKVEGNNYTDAMYIMWSSSSTATYDDVCKAENLHQINPVYVEPALTGNVYLHVVPANYNAGTPTRGAVQTANYKINVDPVLTVSDLTTSTQIDGLTPNYTVTYNNGVEDVTVDNPAVTFALKSGSANDIISINGTTIKGLKEGKVTVVASYAANEALCLNAVQTEFVVNVDLHLYFKAEFENKINYVTVDKGEDPIDLPSFTIKDATGAVVSGGTAFDMSEYTLQEGSDAIVDLDNKQVLTDKPGSAMVKITLTPKGDYTGKYETTNIYIPVMVEETDASKYYAVKKGDKFKLLDKVERNGCTMTFGGWAGYYEDGKTLEGVANGNSGNATYGSVGYHSSDDKTENGGFTQDRWNDGSDISKQTISTLFKNITSGSSNKNPRNETATNPYRTTETSATHSYVRNDQALGETSNAKYDLFSVPCRGAYVKFEPKVDGVVTLHINQKTILEDKTNEFANGRYFQIKDERGKFVMPRTYCSNTATIKTPRYADFKVGDEKLNNSTLQAAIGTFQQEYELNQVLKIGSSVTEAPNFATLYECPVTYSFEAKAGKTYYAYCMVSKMDVAGFEFHTEGYSSAINNVTLNEDGTINGSAPVTNNKISQASITYNRSITANNWNPIVLPYSMNEHQVKYVFGNGEETWRGSAEILYFDHIDNASGSIVFMNHFYKTIVAGVPCLVRPTKDVTSLSLAGCEFPYVTVETPEPMIVSAGDKGDGYNWSSAYTQQQINIGDYYFSATSGIKQKTSGNASTLKGFRGVLKAPSVQGAKVYTVKVIDFDGLEADAEATGLSYVIVDAEGNMSIPTANNIYNMQGQIVRANSSDTTGLAKGIYIVNNKKIYVK